MRLKLVGLSLLLARLSLFPSPVGAREATLAIESMRPCSIPPPVPPGAIDSLESLRRSSCPMTENKVEIRQIVELVTICH